MGGVDWLWLVERADAGFKDLTCHVACGRQGAAEHADLDAVNVRPDDEPRSDAAHDRGQSSHSARRRCDGMQEAFFCLHINLDTEGL